MQTKLPVKIENAPHLIHMDCCEDQNYAYGKWDQMSKVVYGMTGDFVGTSATFEGDTSSHE